LQQQFGKDAGESLADSLNTMGDLELLQVYKNLRNNSSILSAISQTHGNPSELYDFAQKISDLITVHVRMRDMKADDIKPKPFNLDDERNGELVKILRALDAGPALSAAQDLSLFGRGLPEPGKLFDLMENHFATCSSDEFWSQVSVQSQYEFFGLSMNIAHLKMLAARIAGGGTITGADLDVLQRLLKDSDGKPNTELAADVTRIDTKIEPQKVLYRMAAIVRQYYFGERQLYDWGTQQHYTGRLVNPSRDAVQDLAKLEAANNVSALISALEDVFRNSIGDTDFTKHLVVQSFKAVVAPEHHLIFHP
jgi:hypothetical protein